MPAHKKRILFFSGGSALRSLCPALLAHSQETIHIITTFDSGGSSAIIRQAFAMPAVGDLRNRLMALADRRQLGHQAVLELFAHRFSKAKTQSELLIKLKQMALGKHPLISPIPKEIQASIKHHLQFFLQIMPKNFILQGANIGNLILTAGYLENGRQFDPVLATYSRLAQVRGLVRPLANQDLHLAAQLEDGRVIIGQHLITGKKTPPLGSRIKKIFLTPLRPMDPAWQQKEKSAALANLKSIQIRADEIQVDSKTLDLISQAELICYPMGSFYSSLIVNLLPQRIQKAISQSTAPKVFIPNTFPDPEQFSSTLTDWIRTLEEHLTSSLGHKDLDKVLNIILLDEDLSRYPGTNHKKALTKTGLEIIIRPLISPQSTPAIDPTLLAQTLFSLA